MSKGNTKRRTRAKERRKLKAEYRQKNQIRERSRIVSDAREVFDQVFASGAAGVLVVERAACLYHAASLIYAAHKHGVDLIMQAGTAAWPRIPLEKDDGKIHTHFAYEWQGMNHPATRAQIAAGIMPEMHVWAAHVEGSAIIDITTKYIPDQCRKQARMSYELPPPMDYLWATAPEIPAGWLYRPDIEATRWAVDGTAEAITACGRVLSGKLPRRTK